MYIIALKSTFCACYRLDLSLYGSPKKLSHTVKVFSQHKCTLLVSDCLVPHAKPQFRSSLARALVEHASEASWSFALLIKFLEPSLFAHRIFLNPAGKNVMLKQVLVSTYARKDRTGGRGTHDLHILTASYISSEPSWPSPPTTLTSLAPWNRPPWMFCLCNSIRKKTTTLYRQIGAIYRAYPLNVFALCTSTSRHLRIVFTKFGYHAGAASVLFYRDQGWLPYFDTFVACAGMHQKHKVWKYAVCCCLFF